MASPKSKVGVLLPPPDSNPHPLKESRSGSALSPEDADAAAARSERVYRLDDLETIATVGEWRLIDRSPVTRG